MKISIFNRFLAWYQSDFKGAIPFSASLSKIMDFKENDLFQENEQNEHISVKWTDFKGFSKESLLPFVVLVWNITKMTEMNRFQWNQRNNRFQWFQWIFKREPYTVCSFFTENCLFLQNHQILMTSKK